MRQYISIIFLALSFTASTQDHFISFDELKNQSQQSETPIMLVFSGSDWCKPCIQLKKNILDTDEFQSYSDELTFLYLDFPYKKANQLSKEETNRNETLAEKYNEKGAFPQVVIIDHNEKVLGQITYQKSMNTETFIREIESIKTPQDQ